MPDEIALPLWESGNAESLDVSGDTKSQHACYKLKADHKNHVWAWDFIFDHTTGGGTIKCLSIVDEYTRQCITLDVSRSITAENVIDRLAELFMVHGVPEYIRSDNGPEFVAKAIQAWLSSMTVPYSITFEDVDYLAVTPTGIAQFVSNNPSAVLGLLYQGFIVAGFCFALSALLLRRHAASQMSIYSFSSPLFGVLFAVWLRGDVLSPWLAAAAACVIVGIWLVTAVDRKLGASIPE